MIQTECPECGERFRVQPENLGKKARCKKCENVFVMTSVQMARVTPETNLVTRAKKPADEEVVLYGVRVDRCIHHPSVVATKGCQRCSQPLCEACVVIVAGATLCSGCAAGASRPAGLSALSGIPRKPSGIECINHREVESAARCKMCRDPVCEVCRFKIHGVSLCPQCATNPETEVSTGRKVLVAFAYIAAACFTLALAAIFSVPAMARHIVDAIMLAFILGFAIYAAAMFGFAMAMGAVEKRLPNPAYIWAAVIWNSLNLGVLVVFLAFIMFFRK